MAIVTNGLVLYLHGACGKNNPATRVWKDLSGNDNDGELVNFGYTEDSGWVDGGLKFDGVDDYVQLPDLALNPDNFTIQVDDKIRAFNGDKVMTENGDEWGRNLYAENTGVHFRPNNSRYSPFEERFIEDDKLIRRLSVNEGENRGIDYYSLFISDLMNSFTEGKEHTLSCEVRPNVDLNVSITTRAGYTLARGGEWTRIDYTTYADTRFGMYSLETATAIYPMFLDVRNLKIEKGSQATPWTPAPEDITETNIINHTTPFVENNTVHTLRFYNRALTDEEILQNYQAGHEWTPVKGKREVITTMKPITSSLSRKGTGKRELITTVKPITTSLERKGVGKREVISTMKPITSELNRKGVGRREVITTMQPITSSISKKLPPIHANMDIRERTPNITTRERIPKLEVD